MPQVDKTRERLDRLWSAPGASADVVVVVAHPDDEVIGAGAQLECLRTATFVHVTDGAPRDMQDALARGLTTREGYASRRREELAAALELAGIGLEKAREVGLVDQEASLELPALTRWLVALFEELEPTIVLTHPYEGGHPDHDATAFAVHAACGLLERQAGAAPAIVELTSYHDRNGALEASEFLPDSPTPVRTFVLSEAQRARKQAMFDCFQTQAGVLQYFPIGIERFRPAPCYDFTRPPHPGSLWYERFHWGGKGEDWRARAASALIALGLADAPDSGTGERRFALGENGAYRRETGERPCR